jgi:CheY-like chemotaxis protein
MKILIVSTDYDTRVIFATVLRRDGYDVRELAEPDHVVEAARDCDVAITDYPTCTGVGATVTELLRRDPSTRHVKILNATTHAFWHEIDAATAAGVDETIVLPAAPDAVIATVRQLLDEARGGSRNDDRQ